MEIIISQVILRIGLTILIAGGAASAALGAVAIDTTTRNGAFSNVGVTSIGWNHTVGNGISRALYVGISTTSLAALQPVCQSLPCQTLPGSNSFRVVSVTYGGTPLQFVGGRISSDLNNSVEIFRLLLPPVGTAGIVVNLTAGNSTHVVGGAVSFTGVDQSNPNSAFVSNVGNGNSPGSIFSGTAAGDFVFDTVSIAPGAGYLSAGSGQTVQWDGRAFFSNSYDVGAGSTKPQSGSSETMSWLSSGSGNWVHGGVVVKSFASTAAAGTVEGRVLSDQMRAVPGAIVTLTGVGGETRSARTNMFGYFSLSDVPLGAIYIINAKSKGFVFAPIVISVDENIGKLELIAVGR